MRNLYSTKWINRPEMKFYPVLDYTLPSMSPKSTQVEIHNDGGSLGLVMSLKTLSRLSHLIKRESLMFSSRSYCLDFPIFTMIDSKFHFSFEPETQIIYVCNLPAGRSVWWKTFQDRGIFMKNGNESLDVLGDSQKRYRDPWVEIGKYWPGKEPIRLQDSLPCPLKKKKMFKTHDIVLPCQML